MVQGVSWRTNLLITLKYMAGCNGCFRDSGVRVLFDSYKTCMAVYEHTPHAHLRRAHALDFRSEEDLVARHRLSAWGDVNRMMGEANASVMSP